MEANFLASLLTPNPTKQNLHGLSPGGDILCPRSRWPWDAPRGSDTLTPGDFKRRALACGMSERDSASRGGDRGQQAAFGACHPWHVCPAGRATRWRPRPHPPKGKALATLTGIRPLARKPACVQSRSSESCSSECQFAFLKSLHFWKRILPAVLSNRVSCETVSQRVKKVKCGDRSRARLPLRTPRFQHLFPSVAGGNPSNISTLVTEKEA